MRRSLLAVLIVLGLSGLVACGSSGSAPQAAGSPSAPSRVTSAPYPPCGHDAGPGMTLHGSGGFPIDALALGSGPDAVVLLHEAGGAGMCGGLGFATWLAKQEHLQVVMFDRCDYGRTKCPKSVGKGGAQIAAVTQPAVDYARAHGARRVVLVGASSGASDTIQAASAVHDVDAVIALSADVTDTNGPAHFELDRLPTLMAYATGDSYCPPKREHAWFRQVPAKTKRLVVVHEDGRHGWDLVSGSSDRPLPLAHTVAEWAHGRTS